YAVGFGGESVLRKVGLCGIHPLTRRYAPRCLMYRTEENMETIITSIISSISTVSLIGVAVYLGRSWLVERLKASIKFEYDLKVLEIANQKEIQLKAELVADLLAEWTRFEEELDYYELNRLSFQAFVWLPADLANDLSNTLAHKPGADEIREIVKKVRVHLQGKNDDLEFEKVIVFQDPRKEVA
ncbi:DUF3265 domain-containing protein, partial [Vibrio vulnificus]|nr:DUF3265 domain-containing protein [Vibrio vulnificus]